MAYWNQRRSPQVVGLKSKNAGLRRCGRDSPWAAGLCSKIGGSQPSPFPRGHHKPACTAQRTAREFTGWTSPRPNETPLRMV